MSSFLSYLCCTLNIAKSIVEYDSSLNLMLDISNISLQTDMTSDLLDSIDFVIQDKVSLMDLENPLGNLDDITNEVVSHVTDKLKQHLQSKVEKVKEKVEEIKETVEEKVEEVKEKVEEVEEKVEKVKEKVEEKVEEVKETVEEVKEKVEEVKEKAEEVKEKAEEVKEVKEKAEEVK